MADFLDSVKNKVSAAVSRTGWEAQKQMRVRGKQTEIDKLLEQRESLLNDLAQTAIELHQRGMLSDAQLARLCASIEELDRDVQNREAQLAEMKKEAYPVQPPVASQMPDYTPPSATPAYVPPVVVTPNAQAPVNPAGVQGAICPSCSNPVRPNALYCRNCGAKLR